MPLRACRFTRSCCRRYVSRVAGRSHSPILSGTAMVLSPGSHQRGRSGQLSAAWLGAEGQLRRVSPHVPTFHVHQQGCNVRIHSAATLFVLIICLRFARMFDWAFWENKVLVPLLNTPAGETPPFSPPHPKSLGADTRDTRRGQQERRRNSSAGRRGPDSQLWQGQVDQGRAAEANDRTACGQRVVQTPLQRETIRLL